MLRPYAYADLATLSIEIDGWEWEVGFKPTFAISCEFIRGVRRLDTRSRWIHLRANASPLRQSRLIVLRLE